MLDAAVQVLTNKRGEPRLSAKIPSLEVGLKVTMLVKYHETWLVHEHAFSTNNPVEHVQVASAGQ